MEFCDECGSLMIKIDEEWICKSCNPDKFESEKESEYQREAVLLNCPICGHQRPYCGAKGAKLGKARLQMGIIGHLDAAHELDDTEQGAAVISCLDNHEIVNISTELCEKASERGWGSYNI